MKNKSQKKWLKEHFNDEYVIQASKMGYRSRAVFKLQEIDQKDRLISPGMTIVDLGSAPGGWSQYCKEKIGDHGHILALDILPMEPIKGVDFIQGDFTNNDVFEKLSENLFNVKPGLVMSDMAPNISGMKLVDQAKSIYLADTVLDFAKKVLCSNGNLLIKVFQGEGFDEFMKDMKASFNTLTIRKPRSSRPRSSEVYMLAKGLKLINSIS